MLTNKVPGILSSILGKRINYFSTEKIESDGIHTEWNQNAKGDINLMPNFQFKVKMPSLAFLEIEVKDGSFGDLGIFCSPITMIKEHGKNFSKCFSFQNNF